MNNTWIKFGDLFPQQLRGVAMGMFPTPTIAKRFVSLHEQKEILPRFLSSIYFFCRFNDGTGS
jgi:hypothetical protein